MRRIAKLALGLTGAALLASTLAACSSSGSSNTKPVAKIDSLSGKSTSVKLDAGLTLTGGSTKITLENFDINPGKNSVLYGDVLVNGKSAAKHAPLFDLDGSTLQPITISNGVATLTGTRVLVSSTAAGLLDKTFNTQAVKKGLLVGVATILANAK